MIENVKCGRCGYRTNDGKHCGLNGLPVDLEKDNCSFGKVSPPRCSLCGQFLVGPFVVDVSSNKWKQYCQKCEALIGTCQTCEYATWCAFEEDTSVTLPKTIQKQVQQPNGMVMVITTSNPERIAATCAQGCECYDPEQGCLRQASAGEGCKNVVLREMNLQTQ